MEIFDDNQHMHVGYYENGKDLEAIFFKVAGEEKWCLFFDQHYYQMELLGSYSKNESFGSLIATVNGEPSYKQGCLLFKRFLEQEKIITNGGNDV